MQLRAYQSAAVDACYKHLSEREDNPCIVIPTGGGKSLVIGKICRDSVIEWGGRVLLLSHVKELLVQNANHIKKIAPEIKDAVGVYSASLKRRDTEHPVIVAGIQSVYKKACELGRFDLILVDEAHTIPDEGEGMYRRFLAEAKVVNPSVRVIGFTATPYRMKTGYICEPENILNQICYEIGVKQLIDDGFLCRLISKAGAVEADIRGVHIKAGEFAADELEAAMNTEPLVRAAVSEIIECSWNRQAVIIFASGVSHGKHIVEVLQARGQTAEAVFGETKTKERDAILGRFQVGEIRHLVNVSVLTTGFDSPRIDCVALVRPTMSPGLFYQMLGRGLRLNPGKESCLVLDFAGNILRHGPIDAIKINKKRQSDEPGDAPVKKCPACLGLVPAAATSCEYCGFVFPPRELKHEPKASAAAPLTGQVKTEVKRVLEVRYFKHFKRGDDAAPPTMRVEYFTSLGLMTERASEWVCFEHQGFARSKAESWWMLRSSAPIPSSVDEALELARVGAIAEAQSITLSVISGEKYPKIIGYKLGAKPDWHSETEQTEPEQPYQMRFRPADVLPRSFDEWEVTEEWAGIGVAAGGGEDAPF